MSTIKVSITGSNIPRDNHWEIPSGSITPVRTLLIESGPRNNRQVSESIHFTGSVWAFSNVTRTASFAEAPDGTMTAVFIKENTANNTHYFQITAPIGTNSLTGTSIFLKPAGRTRFYVGINDPSGAYAMADITLTGTGSINGTVTAGTSGIPSIRIVPYSGSWYRVDVVARAASFGSPLYRIELHNGTSTSYTGNGSSGVYVWGYNATDFNRGSEINGIAPVMFIRGDGIQTGSKARDVIYWTAPLPQPMTVYVRGIVQGTTWVSAERKIIQFGNYSAGGTNAGISTNTPATHAAVTQFISNYKTVSSTVTPTNGIQPGHAVELSMRLYRTGSGVGTQISYALNGGTVQLGNSSSISGNTGFDSGWYQINSMSLCTSDVNIQYTQAFAYRNILIATGSKTLEQMRALAGI